MSIEGRDRLAGLRDAMERTQSRRGVPTFRQAVQVYDGGAIPTTVPAMFLCRPVGLGVAESEGATPTIAADTSRSIPVLVLGPAIPVAGDDLVATAIGGRWCAEKQGGSSDTLPCSPCSIPKHDLIMSATPYGAGTTLTYHPGGVIYPFDSWFFGDTTLFGFYIVFRCAGGALQLSQGDAADGAGEFNYQFDGAICSPFSAHFHDAAGVLGTRYVHE